jgi:hypothetical protein
MIINNKGHNKYGLYVFNIFKASKKVSNTQKVCTISFPKYP